MEDITVDFIFEENENINANFEVNVTPKKLSELENDTGFITKDDIKIPEIDLSNYATKSDLENKQNKLVAGKNITIVDNVISSTGDSGGSVDAYTKAETDSLLVGKENLITSVSPLVKEYKEFSPVVGYSRPTDTTIKPATQAFSVLSSGYKLADTSYIEFPYNIGEVVKYPFYVAALSTNNGNAMYHGAWAFGYKDDSTGDFIPYIYGAAGSGGSEYQRYNTTGQLAANRVYSTDSIRCNRTAQVNRTEGYTQIQYDASGTPFLYINGSYAASKNYSPYSWYGNISSVTAFNISDINCFRFYPGSVSGSQWNTEFDVNSWAKYPAPDATTAFYNYSEEDLVASGNLININEIQKYNYLKLNCDNTLKVVDGKLTVDLTDIHTQLADIYTRLRALE